MKIRPVLFALLASALSASAFGQEPRGALGPFTPGMTVEEAQGAVSGWTPLPNSLGIVQADAHAVVWNGAPYEFRINFERGRLLLAHARREFSVSSEAECNQAFDALLSEMERQFGPLDGRSVANAADQRLLPSGSLVLTSQSPDGRFHSLAAFKYRPYVNANAITYTGYRDQKLMCALSVAALAPEPLLSELTPATPLPDDIAAAPFIEGVGLPPSARSDFSRFFPSRAMTLELEGFVELDCLVLEGGATRCSLTREAPVGLGFGDAALRIMSRVQMPPTSNGTPLPGRRIHLFVPFRFS